MSAGKQQELRLQATMFDDGDTGSIRLQDRFPVRPRSGSGSG
jgi:hypothetical protein